MVARGKNPDAHAEGADVVTGSRRCVKGVLTRGTHVGGGALGTALLCV